MANLKIQDETGKWIGIPSIQGEPGEKGEKGEPGAGIIPGGLAGQYLRKLTDADYETEWADVEGGNVDLSNYYTKEETDTLVSESSVDDTVLLHYKGHVATIDDLPSTGQASGTLTDKYIGITTTVLGSDETTLSAIKELVGDDYFIGFYKSESDYQIISSPDADAFVGINFTHTSSSSSETASSIYAMVEIDTTKTHNITLKKYNSSDSSSKKMAYRNTSGTTSTVTTPSTKTDVQAVYLGRGVFGEYFYGKLVTSIKYVPNPTTTVLRTNSSGSATGTTALDSTSLRLNFEDNYVYTEGMRCLKSSGDGMLSWVLTESSAEVNEVYTVGENNDIYRCNETPAWELWSKAEKTTSNLVSYVSDNSSSNPFTFEGKQPGLYVFTSGTNIYMKGSSSSGSQISKALGDNTLHIFKEYSEATVGENFGAYSSSDGRYILISKVTSNAYGISDVSVLGSGFNYVKKSGTQSLSNQFNFTSAIPKITSSTSPSDSTHIVTKGYVDAIKPVTLYEDATGTTGNVTLSASSTNYEYIEIFGVKDTGCCSVKVPKSQYANASLIMGCVIDTATQVLIKTMTISGTTITVNGYKVINHVESASSVFDSNEIRIIKVLGHNV